MFALILLIINIQIFSTIERKVTKDALQRLLIVEPYKIKLSEFVVFVANRNGLNEDMFTAEIEIMPRSSGFYDIRYNGKFITLMKNYWAEEKEKTVTFDRSE